MYWDSKSRGLTLLVIRYNPNKPKVPWTKNKYIKKPLGPTNVIELDTKIGPRIEPIPIKILKVDDAEIISLDSKKSFTWATATENIGRDIAENIPERIINKIKDKYDDITIKILNPAAIKVIAINIILLSILSETYPIGHWAKAPKEEILTIKTEISKRVNPFEET